jgi:hypothetical protein
MNNSFIAMENVSLELEVPVDNTVALRQKETELVAIIKAITNIAELREWKLLQEKIFDGVVASLKRQRDTEVEKKPLNGPVIHSLNGQLAWAKKYSDFARLADIYKLELQNIRKQLNAKSTRENG